MPDIRRHAEPIITLVGFFLLALWYLWPLPPHFLTDIIGDNGDAVSNLWPFWYIPHALTHNTPGTLFRPLLQFYPDGVSLIYASLSPVGSFLMAPIALLTSPAAALNTWIFLHIWLGGWLFYGYCRRIDIARAGASIGGIAFACSPFVAIHLPGHYTLVQIGFPAAALYCLAVLAGRSRNPISFVIPAVGLGLSCFAATISDFYLGVMTWYLLFFAAIHLYARQNWPAPLLRKLVNGLALAALTTVICMLPWIWLLVQARSEHNYALTDHSIGSFLVARWRFLVMLPHYQPFYGKWLYGNDPRHIALNYSEFPYLGIVTLMIAAAGFFKCKRRRLVSVWIVAFVVALGFSGGDAWSPDRSWSGTPLDIGVLWPRWFPFSEFRVPSRWQFAICATLAILAAYGADALLSRLRGFRKISFTTVLAAALLFDLWPPIPLINASPSDGGIAHADHGINGTVLDIPVGARSGNGNNIGVYSGDVLLRQMAHGRPVMTTYVSRLPKDLINNRANDPEFAALIVQQRSDENSTKPVQLDWPGFRRRFDVTTIRIPKDWPTSSSLMKTAQKMGHWKWKASGNALIGDYQGQ